MSNVRGGGGGDARSVNDEGIRRIWSDNSEIYEGKSESRPLRSVKVNFVDFVRREQK